MTGFDDQNLWNVPLAFLDFETTGLSSGSGDRVVEVAIIRLDTLDDPNPVKFQRLIQPGITVPKSSIAIHGIIDSMLQDAPPFSEVLDEIARHLNGALLVAHHAPFDIGFLQTECSRIECDVPKHGPVLDTLRLARAMFGFPSCGLSSLAARMNVPLTNHHRALADCQATLAVCRQMLECIDPDKELTVKALIERIEHMTPGGARRGEMHTLFQQAAQEQSTLEIDYTRVQGEGALKTTRRITVQSWRPPNLEAWCHLRKDKRVFRMGRIQNARMISATNQSH